MYICSLHCYIWWLLEVWGTLLGCVILFIMQLSLCISTFLPSPQATCACFSCKGGNRPPSLLPRLPMFSDLALPPLGRTLFTAIKSLRMGGGGVIIIIIKKQPGRQDTVSVMMMMSWCLMSSDVIWHIRDKLWPMPKHGSIKSTYVRCMRV